MQQVAEEDVPMTDEFFTTSAVSPAIPASKEKLNIIRKSFMLKKRGVKQSQRMDPKVFEQSLVDRAMGLLLDYQKSYQFAIIRCTAKPLYKKAAEL